MHLRIDRNQVGRVVNFAAFMGESATETLRCQIRRLTSGDHVCRQQLRMQPQCLQFPIVQDSYGAWRKLHRISTSSRTSDTEPPRCLIEENRPTLVVEPGRRPRDNWCARK